ncbi:hypothetical protein [Elizabethkingia anophelis]
MKQGNTKAYNIVKLKKIMIRNNGVWIKDPKTKIRVLTVNKN